jgi:hypothetical protein
VGGEGRAEASGFDWRGWSSDEVVHEDESKLEKNEIMGSQGEYLLLMTQVQATLRVQDEN